MAVRLDPIIRKAVRLDLVVREGDPGSSFRWRDPIDAARGGARTGRRDPIIGIAVRLDPIIDSRAPADGVGDWIEPDGFPRLRTRRCGGVDGDAQGRTELPLRLRIVGVERRIERHLAPRLCGREKGSRLGSLLVDRDE
jgi:hypothetical protein